MTFNRARSEKSLIQVVPQREVNGTATDYRYPNKTIPIINPILLCYFVESAKADSFYAKSKLYDVNVNFLDYSLRRELLLENIKEFNLKLFEGKEI